ncbi:type IV pilin protein [Shewanella gelidii]|uniref:Type IV minor pilin protein PilE n=1 Tax=Shewanella gelidii TaxID=1642821 RepID=A0A917N6G9_9GAMM|nr:type IV pilin protein [Shewanella gelidii]MCL1096615.1 prepilin-type N-terminal cleavage/methylation domain-containing protein [Shewanella gelidii]GGI68884.1 type IV minor pilin protein PilE [Shewanella gelidii]
MNKQRGFSLIELMIALLIIGVVSSIAYPSYVQYVAQGTRSDGLAAIMRVANLQEQYYLDNRQYTTDMTELGLDTDPFLTRDGDYQVDATGGTTFTITATAKGAQATRDSACASITLTESGVKAPEECWK